MALFGILLLALSLWTHGAEQCDGEGETSKYMENTAGLIINRLLLGKLDECSPFKCPEFRYVDIPQEMTQGEAMAFVLPSMVPGGTSFKLKCDVPGAKTCQWYAILYHCPPCGQDKKGGWPALLPAVGFAASSCAPKLVYDGKGEKHGNIAFHYVLRQGESLEVGPSTGPTRYLGFVMTTDKHDCEREEDTKGTCEFEGTTNCRKVAGQCRYVFCPRKATTRENPPAPRPTCSSCVADCLHCHPHCPAKTLGTLQQTGRLDASIELVAIREVGSDGTVEYRYRMRAGEGKRPSGWTLEICDLPISTSPSSSTGRDPATGVSGVVFDGGAQGYSDGTEFTVTADRPTFTGTVRYAIAVDGKYVYDKVDGPIRCR